jgi:hypothetical protein
MLALSAPRAGQTLVLGRESLIALPIEPFDFRGIRNRNPFRRGLTEPAVRDVSRKTFALPQEGHTPFEAGRPELDPGAALLD